jgi:hypothetical protein
MSKITMAEAAKNYVSRHGLAIVPIEPMRKFPRETDWGEKVITDAGIAEAFFKSNPDWNMGMALNQSKTCSLDVDCIDSFKIICDAFGIDFEQLIVDYPVIQGSKKGLRIMFRVPKGVELKYSKLNWRPESDPTGDKYRELQRKARKAKEQHNEAQEAKYREEAKQYAPFTVLELRAATDGKQRQDVLPPSVHPDTNEPYQWLNPIKRAIPELPKWLLAMWLEFDSKFKRQMLTACPWAEIDEVYKPEIKGKTPRFYSNDGGLVAIAREYDKRNTIEDTLQRYGYKHVTRKRFISPMSSTGLAGVVLFNDNRCWVHHASDPLCSDESGKPVSPFDLFCEYDHGGDFVKATRVLADEYGTTTHKPTYNAPVASAPVSELISSDGAVSKDISTAVDLSENLPWTDEKGKPRNHHENLAEICRRAGIIVRYNVMTKEEEIIIPYRAYSRDNEANASLAELASICSLFNFPTSKLQEFVTLLADQNQYSPVINWIKSTPWDGVIRINDFLNTVTARGGQKEQELKNVLIFRWLMSAIRAAFGKDGVEAHGVLVFAGRQGMGKTAWVKSLVPAAINAVERMVQDGLMLNLDDKDSVKQALMGWISELGEIDSTFKKSAISQLKAFVTRDTDRIRKPYARKESTYARRTVFFGSVNTTEYLQDDTGNRRFWTVDCESINYAHDFDMQQIFAEMCYYYEQGGAWHLSSEERALLDDHNKDFEAGDPIKDRILSAFDWEADAKYWQYMRATDALLAAGIDRPTRGDLTRAGPIIRELNNNDTKRCGRAGRLFFMPPTMITMNGL